MNTLQKRYQESFQTGQVFILTPEDINFGTGNDKEIKSIDDLVMVHKTNYFPKGAIKTPFDTKQQVDSYVSFFINGEEKKYPITVKNFRDTIHFCLNGSVNSHAYGNWDETKYAVFMPLAQNKDRIVAGTECDLFSKGSVPLTDNAYILCPKDEIVRMKNQNPQVNVIGYEGESVSPYVNVFLAQVLGYKFKKPTENSRCWNSGLGKDAELAVSIIKNNGWTYTDHNGSEWSREELRLQKVDLLIQVINIISSEKLLYSEENVKNIYDVVYGRLDTHDLFQGYSFSADLNNDEYFEDICQQVEKATGINMRIFVNGSKKSDKKNYGFGELEKELADTIIKQLRMRCLVEKEQLGILTEKEIIQLHFEQEFGDWHTAITNGIISQDFLSGINEYQKLSNKNLNDLTPEQLQLILSFINARIVLLSKKAREDGHIFKLELLKEVTQEQANAYRSAGYFRKVRSAGVYLTFTAPQLTERLSKLSGINLQEIYNKINDATNDELMYELEKQASLLPHCHIDEYIIGSKVITDCQFLDCLTVRDFNDRIINYAKLFLQFYNGKNVKFDKNGKIIYDVTFLPELPQLPELTNNSKSNFNYDPGTRK